MKLLIPVLVAILVYLARRWGPLLRRLPTAYLPVVAALVGAGVQLLAREVGLGDADVSAIQAALEGAVGYGLAGAGVWSLTAPVRKRKRSDEDENLPAVAGT